MAASNQPKNREELRQIPVDAIGKGKITLNFHEIAELLGINLTSAYELAERDDFPCLCFKRRKVVPVHLFIEWMEREAFSKNTVNSEAV